MLVFLEEEWSQKNGTNKTQICGNASETVDSSVG